MFQVIIARFSEIGAEYLMSKPVVAVVMGSDSDWPVMKAAVDYLGAFNPKGDLAPVMKFGALGDAYSELGDMAQAESMYKKAATTNENEYLTSYYLRKLGILYEHQGNYEEALKMYTEVKEKYPNSASGRDIEKYVARVSNK